MAACQARLTVKVSAEETALPESCPPASKIDRGRFGRGRFRWFQ